MHDAMGMREGKFAADAREDPQSLIDLAACSFLAPPSHEGAASAVLHADVVRGLALQAQATAEELRSNRRGAVLGLRKDLHHQDFPKDVAECAGRGKCCARWHDLQCSTPSLPFLIPAAA
eukprot:scaffold264_cov317-Pinguiococcus_pyrenoidosus.AAC.33